MRNETEKRIYQGSIQPMGFPSMPEGWVSDWETFASSDEKLKLFSVLHHAKEWKGNRVLVVIHGFGEHGGRYLHFPHFVKSVVDAVYCFDQRGHGRSEGIRGHVERFDLYTEDLAHAIRRLNHYLLKKFDHSEIHLVGHSMGGLVALRALFNDHLLPVHSAFISAPLLGLKLDLAFGKRMLALALKTVWGSLQLGSEIDPKILSHDPNLADAYLSDRLVHTKATPLFYTELLDTLADTMVRDEELRVPILMWVPLKDEIVSSKASLQFFESLHSKNKVLITDPEFFHEIFNEIGKEKVFEDLVEWVQSRFKT